MCTNTQKARTLLQSSISLQGKKFSCSRPFSKENLATLNTRRVWECDQQLTGLALLYIYIYIHQATIHTCIHCTCTHCSEGGEEIRKAIPFSCFCSHFSHIPLLQVSPYMYIHRLTEWLTKLSLTLATARLVSSRHLWVSWKESLSHGLRLSAGSSWIT